jgi:molecular chaperone DnaK (HSP70)
MRSSGLRGSEPVSSPGRRPVRLRFTPVATSGDQYLGGDDLDTEIAEALAGLIVKRTG